MQALLIYELCNKNHLKNINDQNFSHFMRGYDKGGYKKAFTVKLSMQVFFTDIFDYYYHKIFRIFWIILWDLSD